MPTTIMLPEGLQILVEELPHTFSASIGAFVRVGARHEPDTLSGVAHFIEHMCFKGTQHLPTALAVSDAVEGVGGILNASTAYESTIYWGKVAQLHLDRALHVLTELLRYPLLDPRELDKERRVIIEEIRGSQDTPSEWVHALIQEAMWGEQPVGRDIAGTLETVTALTLADLRQFWQQHYGANNLIISVAGNVTTAAVVDALGQSFSGYASVTPPSPRPIVPVRPGPCLTLQQRETEQGNFCLGLPGLAVNDPDRRALQALDSILGGGMSSRLIQELREERGLAYNIGSYHSEFSDAGMWVIYGSVEPDALLDSVAVCLDILASLVRNGITADELTRVKEQVKGGMLLSLEDSWSIASRNGSHQLRYGQVIPVEQVIAEIEAVTPADIRRVARRLIRPEGLHLAVIGPYAEPDERELQAIIETWSPVQHG